MQKTWSRLPFWAAVILSVVCFAQLQRFAAASVDLSDTLQRNHVLYFTEHGDHTAPVDGGDAASANTRYVQLSNGSRFVCETTDIKHHHPPSFADSLLNMRMQSIIDSIKAAGPPCTHVVDEQRSIVLCWNREIRVDKVAARTSRILGRRNETSPPDYWTGHDAFGRYVATRYDEGEECWYTRRPSETEIRFYCRYTEMENPVPFLTLHESAQCHFMLRVMSDRFCFVPQLDHAVETETVHCYMLE